MVLPSALVSWPHLKPHGARGPRGMARTRRSPDFPWRLGNGGVDVIHMHCWGGGRRPNEHNGVGEGGGGGLLVLV